MSSNPKSGIYCITNTSNGKSYVGSAVNMRARWNLHRSQLRTGVHHSKHLQAAWAKYGELSFVFAVLELVPDAELLLDVENKWISSCKSACRENGYNICSKAGSQLGMTHSEATKRKMSAARKGRQKSEEHQSAINKSLQGRNLSAEHRAKIAVFRKGKKASNETREKMREANTNRKEKLSPESYERMVTANIGRQFSPEHRAKIAEANRRRTLSPETRAKISAARQLHKQITEHS